MKEKGEGKADLEREGEIRTVREGKVCGCVGDVERFGEIKKRRKGGYQRLNDGENGRKRRFVKKKDTGFRGKRSRERRLRKEGFLVVLIFGVMNDLGK